MSRWIGIVFVAVLYYFLHEKLGENLIGDNSSVRTVSFPQVDHKIMNEAQPTPEAVDQIIHQKNKTTQCFSKMFSDMNCDFDCWYASVRSQSSQLPELVLRDWKKQDLRFNAKNHSDVYVLYQALNRVGLLGGGDDLSAPQYDKAIREITELSLKDPTNYYPYLFLALILDKKGESEKVNKVLRQMDENARHYHNYYSAWMAQLERESAESLKTFSRGIYIGSQLPIPSVSGILKLANKYSFDKKKLVDAMIESIDFFKSKHPYSILSISMIDFVVAGRLSDDPKLKARKNDIFNPGMNLFLKSFSSDFPLNCERSAVEAWFQKHRSEIQ